MKEPVKVYGVFEGGGVKIIALAGALKAAEEDNIQIVAWAGSSAGAIIAALCAVGYSSKEIENIVLTDELDYSRFQDGFDMDLHSIFKLYRGKKWRRICLPFTKQHRSFRKLQDQLLSRKGIYQGKMLQDAVDKFLKEKGSDCTDPDNRITFGSLYHMRSRLLKIVASDIVLCRPIVFEHNEYPQVTLAEAIRASTSIPLFFQPPKGDDFLIDGGLISNFPAWVFDAERRSNPMIVTLGFRVRQRHSDPPSDISLRKYLELLGEAALAGADFLQFRGIRRFLPIDIQLKKTVRSFNFLLDHEQKKSLFNEGYESAKERIEQFRFLGLLPPAVDRDVHKEKIQSFLEAAARDLFPELTHIRASIMQPISTGSRKVLYGFNYEQGDKDSDLELAMDSGCSGYCWTRRVPALANLEEAKKTYKSWGLTDEQQRKVRQTLKWMLSVPIFEPTDIPPGKLTSKQRRKLGPVGILNFDSDLKHAGDLFSGLNYQKRAEEWAQIFSRILVQEVL